MPYNSLIARTDAAALIPEDVADLITREVTDASAALTLFRQIPVAQAQTRIPILSALPTAYWVTGDTGLKQTTQVAWSNRLLNIEELAAIIPIPESVFDDMAFDVWDAARPLLVEAIGRAFDAAVFFGTNAPASFPANINAQAATAGNNVTEAAAAAAGAFFGDIDALLAPLEADGYDADAFVAARSARARFRAARSTTGEGLDRDRINAQFTELDGAPVAYPMRGLFPAGGAAGTNVRMFAMQRDQFIAGVRRDITWKMLDQAVIQDAVGAIQYNLAQQDMVAIRVTYRAGWQVANIINRDQATEASRYPASVLRY